MSLRGQHTLSGCECPLLHDFSHPLMACPPRLDAFERYRLQLRIERKLANTGAFDDLSLQLRRKHPQSPETQLLDAGRFDE